MSAQGVAEDSAPTEHKHSMRVEWFGRDPGGGTLFVSPVQGSDSAPAHSGVDNGVDNTAESTPKR